MRPETREKYLDQIESEDNYPIGIHPLQILVDLHDKKYNQLKLAGKIGKSQAAINQVIHRKSSSVKIRECISKILEKPFVDVWGMTKEESVSKKK